MQDERRRFCSHPSRRYKEYRRRAKDKLDPHRSGNPWSWTHIDLQQRSVFGIRTPSFRLYFWFHTLLDKIEKGDWDEIGLLICCIVQAMAQHEKDNNWTVASLIVPLVGPCQADEFEGPEDIPDLASGYRRALGDLKDRITKANA